VPGADRFLTEAISAPIAAFQPIHLFDDMIWGRRTSPVSIMRMVAKDQPELKSLRLPAESAMKVSTSVWEFYAKQ
jgi:hypothetical protein